LENLDFPDAGLKLQLRGYGWITVFRFVAKNGRIDYIGTNEAQTTRESIETHVKARWNVEIYHRELKQTCRIERCQARSGRAQRNHISQGHFRLDPAKQTALPGLYNPLQTKMGGFKTSHRNSPQHTSHPKPLTYDTFETLWEHLGGTILRRSTTGSHRTLSMGRQICRLDLCASWRQQNLW